MANQDLYTFVNVYNDSGDTLVFSGTFDPPFPYPQQIRNGDSAWFVHTSVGSSDTAVVTYNFNQDQFSWLVLWENPWNSQNKVYTEIQRVSDALPEATIKDNLQNPTSDNESTYRYGGYLAHEKIGDGNYPVLQAVLTKVNAQN